MARKTGTAIGVRVWGLRFLGWEWKKPRRLLLEV